MRNRQDAQKLVRVLHTSLSTLSHSIFRRIRLNTLAEFISSA